MIQNKVIRENEFMPRETILLLQTVSTLKRLGESEELIGKLLEKAKGEKEQMLAGLPEQLTVMQEKYTEESYGYTALQRLIDDMNGGR